MVDLFIGREDELKESLRLLTTPSDGIVQDIMGVHGVGKSTYLKEVSDRAKALELPGQQIRVYPIDMARHGLGEGFPPGDLGANASLDMLWEVITRSRQLMNAIAAGQHEFDDFRLLSIDVFRKAESSRAEADRSRKAADITLGKGASIGTAEIITYVKEAEGEARQRIRALQSLLDSTFAEAWAEFAARRRVLITLDTFQLAAGNELGQWFIRMAMRLRNTLTVLARTPGDRPLWPETPTMIQTELPFFTSGEVARYLQRRLGATDPVTSLAETTYEFTNGHPGGVNLVGNLIINKGGLNLSPAELRRLLDGLPAEEGQRWAELVVLILEAVQEPVLLRAVHAASVTATFDGGLLAELVDAANPQDVAVDKIISKLSGLRMLQQVQTMSGGPSDRFRLHEFIRRSVALRLRTFDSNNWQRLQSVAARHYFRLLEEWEEEPYASYGVWYRFEDPQWQDCKREWLRHEGMAVGGNAVTRARFTLVFLEAFWWWGYYLPFPFMRRTLEDWARSSAEWGRARTVTPVPLEKQENPNQLLLKTLTDFINDYPVTHVKPPTAPWERIRENLVKVRTLCGLMPAGGLSPATKRRATEEEEAQMTRADAFITLFLAQTRRFPDPADPRAERLYKAAAEAFDKLKDEWTSAWIGFERADMALERRDLGCSARLVAEAAVKTRALAERTQEWDQELLGNLHRTWADVCWHKGRLDDAARGYGRAVAHAYWYHGEPNAIDGDPHGPDEYTQQFYSEMTQRAAARIAELKNRPAERALFVSGLWRQVPHDSPDVPPSSPSGATVDEIRASVFPAGPADNELRRVDTSFMAKWNVLYLDKSDPLTGLDELASASVDEPGQ